MNERIVTLVSIWQIFLHKKVDRKFATSWNWRQRSGPSEWVKQQQKTLKTFFGQTMWTILIMGTMQTFCTSLALSLYFIFTSVSFHSGNWCFFSTDYFRDLKADCMVASEVKAIIRTNICSKPFLLPFCFHTSLLVLTWDLKYFALAYIFNLFQLNGFERQTHRFSPRCQPTNFCLLLLSAVPYLLWV